MKKIEEVPIPETIVYPQDPGMDEEELRFLARKREIKLALRRNILKKTLSEDLIWADLINADNPKTIIDLLFQNEQTLRNSLNSTPERKNEIPSEHPEDEISNCSTKFKSKKGKNKKKTHTSSSSTSGSQKVYPSTTKRAPEETKIRKSIGKGSNQKSSQNLGGFYKHSGEGTQSTSHINEANLRKFNQITAGDLAGFNDASSTNSGGRRMHSLSTTDPPQISKELAG